MKTFLIILLGSLTLGFNVLVQGAELKLEIIPLQYRTASELIPVIRPLLIEGATVTGMNDQLIIKSTHSNISDIKSLLEQIDKQPRRLMITVANEISGVSGGKHQSVTGNYSSGNIDISNRPVSKVRKGSSISVTDSDTGNIQYRVDGNKTSSAETNNFQLQTLEGQPAYIDTGQLVPVAGRTAFVTNSGVVIQDNIEFHNASSGFYVVPNINGNIVTLQVSPYMSRVNPDQNGVIDVQNIETTVRGRLGEWIEIGGIAQHSRRNESGILYNKERNLDTAHSVLLKVEELK